MADVPYVLRPSALERLPLSIRRVANAEMQNIRGQFLPVFFAALDPTRIPAPHDLEIPSEALGTICTLDIPSTAQLALWSRALCRLHHVFKNTRPTFRGTDENHSRISGCLGSCLDVGARNQGFGTTGTRRGGLDALAALVIDSIFLAVPSSSKGIQFLLALTTSCTIPSTLSLALRNIVECLTIALSTLIPATNIEPKSAIGIISVILTSIFQSPGGHQRSPTLRDTDFSTVSSRMHRDSCQNLLGLSFTKSSLPAPFYYTVLRGISEPFYEVQKLATSESFRVSPFFRNMLMQRFDDQAEVSPRGCDNPKDWGETEFRRCSVCKAFRYCSKNCQLGDWLRTHRRAMPPRIATCIKVGSRCTSTAPKFTHHTDTDEHFTSRANIFRDQIPILRDNPKAIVETFPVSAAREKVPSLNGTLWSERVSQASESDGRMELHVVVLRDGANERCWVMPCPRLPSAGQHGEAGVKAGLQNLPLVQIH
ncbi:hypothetical protein B0H14DRAFT_2683762 [Mycena olivaceomarginata]|nr:hypothetical protein B0H14DRAFT_2683762 [Mycena olivaceomarginata]